jgi:hypothetical protein
LAITGKYLHTNILKETMKQLVFRSYSRHRIKFTAGILVSERLFLVFFEKNFVKVLIPAYRSSPV